MFRPINNICLLTPCREQPADHPLETQSAGQGDLRGYPDPERYSRAHRGGIPLGNKQCKNITDAGPP